jgi:hypothetical protein
MLRDNEIFPCAMLDTRAIGSSARAYTFQNPLHF